MTKEQAEKKIAILNAENTGAVAGVFMYSSVQFWHLFVASSPDETFPEWHNYTPENLDKWHRLDKARTTASERNIEIHCEIRRLRRIAGLDPII